MLDFLVFAPNPWRGLWRNRQQIFSRLAGPNRVLYVEPERTSLRDWRQGRVSLADLRRPALAEIAPRLWTYRAPAWMPRRGGGGSLDRVSERLLAGSLRRVLRRLRFEQPVLWLYRPTNWRWAAQFDHRLLVYHVTDDYTAFDHLSRGQRLALAEAERSLLAAADLTIVTAPRLLTLKQLEARRIELVRNGVDVVTFRAALAAPRPPAALAGLPRPILGYSGHISQRLDLDLLRRLAVARPGWRLAFAGSEWDAGCAEALTALKALPNVHFLGLLPVADVPHFIAACDVCLIPYRVTEETRAISSLKLYEYLAAGRPVVSAAVPAAEEYAGLVRIAPQARPEAWLAAVESALAAADDPEERAARQAVAAANAWDDRVAQIAALLADALSL